MRNVSSDLVELAKPITTVSVHDVENTFTKVWQQDRFLKNSHKNGYTTLFVKKAQTYPSISTNWPYKLCIPRKKIRHCFPSSNQITTVAKVVLQRT
mmetsp:Transcript_9571/g.15896  ORF Transcript_9571/g.15896 Transcript_9571/m.15896 type:complete len:96 (-) Transcript_9571:275-562(-)